MRILQVTEASSAGVGRHVMDLVRGLSAAGHDVRLAYARARVDARFDAQLADWGAPHVHVVPMSRGPHWRDLAAARSLKRLLRDEGPFDVVHAHSTKAGLLTRLLPRSLARGWVFTPHCPFSMRPGLSSIARAGIRTLDRGILRRADRVVAVSEDEGRHLATLGAADRVTVVVNGLQLRAGPITAGDRAERRQQLAIPDDGPLVGFVGRLSSQKDPGLLVEAMARVFASVPQARLAIAGWGPMDGELRSRVTELGIGERVHFLGYVDGEGVLPAFDVFALPSRYEGMPYVLLEALAAGLPIVSTEVGGAHTAVAPEVNGVVTPVGNVDAFAEALIGVLADPERRARFAAASWARAAQFTVDQMVDQTVAIYEAVVDGLGTAGAAAERGVAAAQGGAAGHD